MSRIYYHYFDGYEICFFKVIHTLSSIKESEFKKNLYFQNKTVILFTWEYDYNRLVIFNLKIRRNHMSFVEFKHVKKNYRMGEVEINALKDVNFCVEKGEFAVIVGASGAGKTTILNILGGMDAASSGVVTLDGEDISSFNQKRLTTYRRHDVGFVFQFYNLVQNLTAVENVELASQICKNPLDAMTVIERVGLKDRAHNFPAQLSGGEQQRVAIARALAKNPKLLLCDEPTGALDYSTGKMVLSLLQETCRSQGMTVIVITHNQALTAMADRIITVKSGTVVDMHMNDNIIPVEQIDW